MSANVLVWVLLGLIVLMATGLVLKFAKKAK